MRRKDFSEACLLVIWTPAELLISYRDSITSAFHLLPRKAEGGNTKAKLSDALGAQVVVVAALGNAGS